MPPSQRSSGRSADESNSEGRLSRRSSKYIDIDIGGDAVAVKSKSRSSQLRSDRGRSRRSDAGYVALLVSDPCSAPARFLCAHSRSDGT